jgi:hypothetical protein
MSTGTLTSFDKVTGIMESLGNNVRTNFEAWEMQRMYDLYVKLGDVEPQSKSLTQQKRDCSIIQKRMTRQLDISCFRVEIITIKSGLYSRLCLNGW